MSAIILSAILGVVLMFAGIVFRHSVQIRTIAILCFTVLLGATIYDFVQTDAPEIYFNGMLQIGKMSTWFNLLIVGCSLLYILIFNKRIAAIGKNDAEYFALMLFILCGLFLLSTYNHLLILFIGIEILSIPQYILAGSDKENLKSNEASLKYFLMGAFSTGILLMGITLIYGAVGSFDLSRIAMSLEGEVTALPMVGMLFLLVALGFKVSAAPMHWWTADVYDGTPTAITPFMATIVKVGAFYGFMRLFHFSFGQIHHEWSLAMAVIICLTLLIGNVTAVYQQSVKRMLAYSSVAQAGFMLFAVFAINEMAEKAIVYYAVAYTLASFGIFAVLIRLKDYTVEGFNGLAKKEPVLALTATISLLSLAGIPVTSGFFAKFFVLKAALVQGPWAWLVVFAVLMAAISIYYYFKVIRSMYFKEGQAELVDEISLMDKFLLLLNATLILVLGIFPQLIIG